MLLRAARNCATPTWVSGLRISVGWLKGQVCGFAQALGKMRLRPRPRPQCRPRRDKSGSPHGHRPRRRRAGSAPSATAETAIAQLRQANLLKNAMSAAAAGQHGFEYGFAGHECACHVGKQAGWQMGAVHQPGFGLIGEVMAGYIAACLSCRLRVPAIVSGSAAAGLPAQTQLGQGGGAK